MGKTHFTPALFEFLVALDAHNNRAWFQAHKARYQRDVQEPMLAFIADVDRPLRGISPRFVADPRPVGGSMFRIYRDVRFSSARTSSRFRTSTTSRCFARTSSPPSPRPFEARPRSCAS